MRFQPLNFENDQQKNTCTEILESLTEEEQEQAALSSFAYANTNWDDEKIQKKQVRKELASRMVRRHLVAHKGNAQKALDSLKETIEFRRKKRVNEIRNCFQSEAENDEYLTSVRAAILRDTSPHPKMIVRGYDKRNRATLIKFQNSKFVLEDEEVFLNVQIYWVERAIACTERQGLGEEQINMAIDYAGYSRENKPPMSLLRKLIGMLQAHYPERLHLWIACDPTRLLKTVWTILSVFVEPRTREKVVLVTGDTAKTTHLSKHYSVDQAMPFLLPGGRSCELTSEAMHRFLYDVPFDHDYDGR